MIPHLKFGSLIRVIFSSIWIDRVVKIEVEMSGGYDIREQYSALEIVVHIVSERMDCAAVKATPD